jgi:putative transposase
MEYVSERRSCELVELHRTVFRQKTEEKDADLKDRIRKIATGNKRYGYRRICIKIRKTERVNHKKIYRLYSEMGLKYRRKSRKKPYLGDKVPLVVPSKPGERWSMDFISDSLYDGRKFRVLNVIDDCSREAIIQHAGFSIGGKMLVRIFEELKKTRSLPQQIVCDNGPEFTSKAFRCWASENNVTIRYIDKGKPTQNAYIESFNGKFRDECLNEEWFRNIVEARLKINAYKIMYNTERPHSGIGGMTPYEFIAQIA